MLAVDIKKLFSREAIAQVLESYPPIKTPVMDEFFPEARRKTHPFSKIGIEELKKDIPNVPVVKRGTAAYPVSTGGLSITEISPLPIEISDFLDAAQLNDLKLLDSSGLAAWRDMKIQDMRQIVRKSTEALAGQALSGTINYPMKTESGFDYYQIDFGSPLTYSPDKTWDDTTVGLADIFEDLTSMAEQLEENTVYANDVKFYAGKTAFATLIAKARDSEAPRGLEIRIGKDEINIGGYIVKRLNERYYDLKAKAYKYVIDPKAIKGVGTEAPFKLYYLAIDDIKAGLQPLPFFINPVEKDNPSGIELIAKSKPLPVPVVNAMIDAQVIA